MHVSVVDRNGVAGLAQLVILYVMHVSVVDRNEWGGRIGTVSHM